MRFASVSDLYFVLSILLYFTQRICRVENHIDGCAKDYNADNTAGTAGHNPSKCFRISAFIKLLQHGRFQRQHRNQCRRQVDYLGRRQYRAMIFAVLHHTLYRYDNLIKGIHRHWVNQITGIMEALVSVNAPYHHASGAEYLTL